MKRSTPRFATRVAACFTAAMAATSAFALDVAPLADARLSGDEIIETPYGKVELQHTYITDESSDLLYEAMDRQRAAQAYI